jgi:hypothetical protein
MVLQEDLPRGRCGHAPAGRWPARVLPPCRRGTPAIDIRPRIHRMMPQLLAGRLIGPTPDQVSLGEARRHPTGQLEPMADHIAPDAPNGAEACQLIARLVDAIEVADQGATPSTDFPQLMPSPVRTG